ncbi:hypothetical protein CWI36_3521p0010 [Hamiltosporidium magnivora]|uniref:Uncharacterized protein n=1 Tax=Hamiltosporidium magnivora TaxID=148818 RepID=A0A4Q9KPR9_9MICR|nr:hypothetical protein CWI36_3521p0010 [Hamiltosporidium magnivora]
MGVVERADMLEKPKILLKQGIKKVDVEPTINLNKESNLEEEKIVVKGRRKLLNVIKKFQHGILLNNILKMN